MRTRRFLVLFLSAGLLALSLLVSGVGGATGSSVAMEVPPDPGTPVPTNPCTDNEPTNCTWHGGG